MKRLLALLLAGLLAGCAGPVQLVPEAPASSAAPTPEPMAERVLAVWDEGEVLSGALESYAAAQGVRVEAAASAETADLAVLAGEPGEGQALDLMARGPLVQGVAQAAVGEADHCFGLPLGGARYGYLASKSRLAALLGDGFDPACLEKATVTEWRDFLAALAGWIKEPSAVKVTLNGTEYALPGERPEALESLAGAFTAAAADQYAGPVLAPVLAACYSTADEVAAGGATDAERRGALNSLWTLLTDELASFAGPAGAIEPGGSPALTRADARAAFAGGQALFYRAASGELAAAGIDESDGLVLPLRFTFDETDLHGGLALDQIAAATVSVGGGWVAIPAAADEAGQAEAEAFILWLYASETGRPLAKALTAGEEGSLADLSAGLTDAEAAAFAGAGASLAENERYTAATRTAFTGAVLSALD